jgi:NADH-quinone oxidoreductase subunit M
VGTFVCALGPKIALAALLRVNYTLLPESARWAEGPLVALGAVSVAYAGLLAVAERDWRRQLAHVTVAHSGLALASMASATTQGFAAVVALLPAQALSIAVALLAQRVIEDRVGTRELDRLGGLARASAGVAGVVALAHASIAGLPGMFAFWGELLAASALAPAHFIQLAIAGAGLVLVSGALVFTVKRALLGALPREIAALAVKDGKLAPLDGPEIAAIAPLVVVLVIGCVYPHPVLACAAAAARRVVSIGP